MDDLTCFSNSALSNIIMYFFPYFLHFLFHCIIFSFSPSYSHPFHDSIGGKHLCQLFASRHYEYVLLGLWKHEELWPTNFPVIIFISSTTRAKRTDGRRCPRRHKIGLSTGDKECQRENERGSHESSPLEAILHESMSLKIDKGPKDRLY